MTHADAFLNGIEVLELGGGVAGSAAAAVLASLGARVSKVPTPTDDHRASSLEWTLDRDKRVVPELADVGALAKTSDIVILDGDGGVAGAYAVDGVLVSITPFGLDGPRAGMPGGELVAQAAGGLLGTIEADDGTPVPAPGFVASRTAGAVAALAALHGLDRCRANGVPVHVDVSVQEAVAFTAALPECAHVLYQCPGRAGSGRYVSPSGLFPCRDGLVRITAVENHQWKAMVAALGTPSWTAGLDDRPSRADEADLITEHVGAWTAQQDKHSCAALLQSHGVPSAPVNTPGELLESPQFLHRGALVSVSDGGVPVTMLGTPWRTWPGGPTATARRGSVVDLRISELTHVLAGPIVGALLGAMGASVERLEDPQRLDIYRRTGPFAEGVAGVERGAYFAVANHSKRSVLLDATNPAEGVARSIATADVVIENVGGARLDRLDVRPAELAEAGSLMVRVSGFGTDGPMAGHKVYANTVQAYGGLAGLTRDAFGRPAKLGTVIADPLSSVTAATVIAAWALGPARHLGAVVDLSMAEVVAGTVAEFVAEASAAQPHSAADGGGLRGVYGGGDGRWVAVECTSKAEMATLVDLVGAGDSDYLDEAVRNWVAQQPTEEAAAKLTAAGVRAAVVLTGLDLVADPHLEARGFFPPIAHPEPTLTSARLVGLPWRFAGEGPIPLGPPPALGSSNP